MEKMSGKTVFSIKKLIENIDDDRKKATEILEHSKVVANSATPDEFGKILLGQSKVVENLQKSNQQLLELVLSEMKKKGEKIDPTDFSKEDLKEAFEEVEID